MKSGELIKEFDGKIVLRLDDACPTDKKEVWDLFEVSLSKCGIKPIIAVIPMSKDANLKYRPFDTHFWERIRGYQSKGFTIALHGYEHVLQAAPKGLVPLNSNSEFCGIPLEVQRNKICKGYREFIENGVHPDVWIAPAHTFDENTLIALKLETDIRIVSDGLALFPFNNDGFLWIPQQLRSFKKIPIGVWTICLHPNLMNLETCKLFLEQISSNLDCFTSVSAINKAECFKGRRKNIPDYLFEWFFLGKRIFKTI